MIKWLIMSIWMLSLHNKDKEDRLFILFSCLSIHSRISYKVMITRQTAIN